MPYRFQDEISTADVAFEAWGKTEEELFTSCASALLRTMAESPEHVKRRQELTIRLEDEELDLLLLAFLNELIFHKDACRLLLHADTVRIEKQKNTFRLEAHVSGEKIHAGRHHLLVDVKAVTLHCFQVAFKDDSWKAFVVLDV